MRPYPWIFIVLSLFPPQVEAQREISHYVFFNLARERIKSASFLDSAGLAGAQLKYTWRQLEPQKDRYDFSLIEEDLAFLERNGKKLFIQVQDVSFDTSIINAPAYLLTDEYGRGIAPQFITDESENILRQDGFVARRWDPLVAERFGKLLAALGESLDGLIEGITLPETAVGFGDTGKLYPPGFTPEIYRDAILVQMRQAGAAFPKSTVIQYANFMPGEWLPWDDKGYLESLYAGAGEAGVGMGGPDIKIWKRTQMNHSYKFLRMYTDELTIGIAVQWGNYEEDNPKTGQQVTVPEIFDFGKQEIKLDYIFWSTQEPYYSGQVLPFLNGLAK
jgi:hypothetical protein